MSDLYNVVRKTLITKSRIACLPIDKAHNEALQAALKEYNRLRDILDTWPNSKDLVVLTVRQNLDGYDLHYNDNPSMAARLETLSFVIEPV